MRTTKALLSLGAAAALAACCPDHFPAARPPEKPQPLATTKLDVGAVRIDVTPPPGPSTFGHGPDAMASNGYWTRLYCRAFVLRPAGLAPLAIVPCDLAAMSHLLQRKTAERVAQLLAGTTIDVPPSRLMMMATHTHQGPGHYFENEAYGGFLSTRLPGFDEAMVDFLAERIAQGVAYAAEHPEPAAVRWVHDEVWGLTHNRSILAYEQNAPPWQVPEPAPGTLQQALGHEPSPEERAVNPALDVLEIERIDRATGRDEGPIGSLTFYAMHPTVMPAHTRTFDADVFGVASRVIERAMRERWAASGSAQPFVDPLAGIVNTAEGDLVPNWFLGTRDECVRVGTRFGEAILERMEHAPDAHGPLRQSVAIATRYVERYLPNAPVGTASLCDPAVLGQASAHGGSDHACTIDTLAPNPPDAVDDPTTSQSPKYPLLGGLQPLLVGPQGFEDWLPMAMARIDDTWISFVPAELTMNAGRDVDLAVLGHAHVDPENGRPRAAHAVVAGLSNAYVQYVTTYREYQVQAYEGGSDLYGAHTARYLAEQFETLAKSIAQEPVDDSEFGRSRATTYSTAPERPRFPRTGDYAPMSHVSSRGAIDVCRIPGSNPAVFCFDWLDAGPSRVALTQPYWLQLVHWDGSPVSVRRGATYELVDDRGIDFQTHVRGKVGDAWEWTTLFSPPADEWRELEKEPLLRIRAFDAVHGSVTSVPFDPRSRWNECTPANVRVCVMP